MNINSNTPSSVLFVDDEEKARKYFALAMTADFTVMTAGSAEEALEILKAHGNEIAIVISDQRMPEKTGVELLKIVKDYYPHIVRLLTTAYTDLDDAIEAINRGEILRYIQKPWDVIVLKTELKQAMNYFHIRNERDSLLEEKLSVRQRMVQIERISQLMLLADALPQLRFTQSAVRHFIDLLLSNKAAYSGRVLPNDSNTMDFWDLTMAEINRMQKFFRAVTAEIGNNLPARTEFDQLLGSTDLEALLQQSLESNATGIQAKVKTASLDSAFSISADRKLLNILLDKMSSIAGSLMASEQGLDVSMSKIDSADQKSGLLQISFAGSPINSLSLHEILTGSTSKEIPLIYSELLMAYLICYHHGGSLEFVARDNSNSMVLKLPANPTVATQTYDNPDWHAKVLQQFEAELY